MKKHLIPVGALALAAVMTVSAAKKASDPTLLTVNGKNVPVSEFLYLFQKNNQQQQQQPQSLDEYLDLFIKYKLKVADAEALHIDTTAAFIKEYDGYCAELARPYLVDESVNEALVAEAYSHYPTVRQVSHIMLPMGRTPEDRMANKARLDSIRTEILAGRADFADMARKYSADRSAKTNGGTMGFMGAGQLPYPFEKAMYETPVGQISEVIDDTPYGWHIIRVDAEKPNPGQVQAAHILKMTRGVNDSIKAVKKAQIDSLYTVLKGGADFADVARRESEDPGSARNGGSLGFFGPGRMVKEFETVAFALPDGGISEPFETPFGYHIILRQGSRPYETLEQARPVIERMMKNDYRKDAPYKARVEQLRKQYGAKVNTKVVNKYTKTFEHGIDSIRMAQLLADYTTVANVGGRKVLVKDAAQLIPKAPLSVSSATQEFGKAVDKALDNATVEHAQANLKTDNTDYRNLINEYRDGMLLYEVSNANVWNKANTDRQGLANFFNAHRDNYTWPAPKYKAIIVSATNDSIVQAAERYLQANPCGVDSIVAKLRAQFGNKVKVERKVLPKGEDAIIDYLGFGGEKPAPDSKWKTFFQYQGKMLTAPEEPSDDRMRVVNDYQTWLEEQWLGQLKAKYPVTVNQTELKKLKESK